MRPGSFAGRRSVEPDDRRLPQPLPWWLEKENHFQASRKGMQANIVYTKNGECKQLTEIWKQVIETVRPIADELGDGHWLDQLQENVNSGPGYKRQLRHYEENDSLTDIVSTMSRELEDDLHLFRSSMMRS